MSLAYIGMGSNQASPAGPPEATLVAAVHRLESLGSLRALSSLYSTEPVGYADQPRFLNAVAALETDLTPRNLLNALLQIERDFGRDRSVSIPNGPRPLDLDILILGNLEFHEPGLDIPHPRMAERDFVMVPLAETASNFDEAQQPPMVSKLLKAFHERSPDPTQKADAVLTFQGALWRARGSRNSAPRSL
jgi:2-amino-4-hydroxy-6-hydroxymethyldihydropteridine diphosphokinase